MLFKIAESSEKVNVKLSDIMYVKTYGKGRQAKDVILKCGTRHVFMDCAFNELLGASSYLIRINKSELISIEAFQKIEGDLITMKGIIENGKPKHVTLNRWFKKDFMARLSSK